MEDCNTCLSAAEAPAERAQPLLLVSVLQQLQLVLSAGLHLMCVGGGVLDVLASVSTWTAALLTRACSRQHVLPCVSSALSCVQCVGPQMQQLPYMLHCRYSLSLVLTQNAWLNMHITELQ
jgi:hypothetical protein